MQSAFYSAPPTQLWLRGVISSLALTASLMGWTSLNTQAETKNQYGAIHEFSASSQSKHNVLNAIQRHRDGNEVLSEYRRASADDPFRSTSDGSILKLNTADYITVEIQVEAAKSNQTQRLVAILEDEMTYDRTLGKKTFAEVNGNGSITEDDPGTVTRRNDDTIKVAVALNFGVLIVCTVCFWAAMRFQFAHASGLAILYAAPVIILLMPLIFQSIP
jgi:hypothetical protein